MTTPTHRRSSEKSNAGDTKYTRSELRAAGITELEFFWSIELNAENKTFTWMNDEDLEDDDEDFIQHTVFLKAAVLGPDAVSAEHNVVMLESDSGEGKKMKGAIVNLCKGQNNMTVLDISLSGKAGPTTFTLAEGTGPIFISGNHLMEYPSEDDLLDKSQTESEEEETEEEGGDNEDDETEETDEKKIEDKKPVKRKGGPIAGKPKQKAKMDTEEDEDDDEEEEEEDEEEEEEEEEEEMESEEESEEEEVKYKLKKGKKTTKDGKKETPKSKTVPAKKVKKGKK